MLFRRQQPIMRHYVSETDLFLQALELKGEHRSLSRLAEEQKHAAIAKARDIKTENEPVKRLWEDF